MQKVDSVNMSVQNAEAVGQKVEGNLPDPGQVMQAGPMPHPAMSQLPFGGGLSRTNVVAGIETPE